MIVNEQDGSMVVLDGENSIQKPISFLNKYISEMKNN